MRFTFKIVDLYDGIPFMPALIGLFSISQILDLTAETHIVDNLDEAIASIKGAPFPGLTPTIARRDYRHYCRMLPGAGATISAFISYNFAKQSSADPDTFGRGTPKGLRPPRALTTVRGRIPHSPPHPGNTRQQRRRPSWEGL